MKIRHPYRLPEEKEEKLKKSVRLEWVTIFFLITITAVMFLTMGASQAMRTAWIEDVLSLIPPIAFLVSMRFRDKSPTANHPYGFHRAPLLAFLVAAVAILILGLYMLYESSTSLINQHHPTIGYFSIFGMRWQIWSGWIMIAVLLYSMIPPVILGRMKLPLSKELHEKTLHADADMNKADWLTAGAGIIGILGVGLGFWWADAVAAAFISLDVLKDGVTNVKRAMSDLMDQRPTAVEDGEPLDISQRLQEEVRALPDVHDAAVRLREEGHVMSGEIFVVMAKHNNLSQRLVEISEYASKLDWRLYDLLVIPVKELEEKNIAP